MNISIFDFYGSGRKMISNMSSNILKNTPNTIITRCNLLYGKYGKPMTRINSNQVPRVVGVADNESDVYKYEKCYGGPVDNHLFGHVM